MGIKEYQFREMIRNTLKVIVEPYMDIPYSKNAEELLLFTAVVESNAGEYLYQINGPALGLYQMEPSTYDDLFNNYLAYKELSVPRDDSHRDTKYPYQKSLHTMSTNLTYQTVIARLQYYRFSEGLPSYKDAEKIFDYYKKYWNSYKGAAEKESCLNKYYSYLEKSVG